MFDKICFIGAGEMAEAIIKGLIHSEVLDTKSIYVTNKENKPRLDNLHKNYGVTTANKQLALADTGIVILATKPHDAPAAIESVKPYLAEQLVISVVAGLTISQLEEMLGKGNHVVRTMPNTSAAVAASATAICGGTFTTAEDIQIAENMFQTIGKTIVVAEEDMHIITAISGSGPAYVYYLLEALEEAAVATGLSPEVTRFLLTQLVSGAGAMLDASSEDPGSLRQQITSPNGTTEAGVNVLKDNNFAEIVRACVDSAYKRSIELGEK